MNDFRPQIETVNQLFARGSDIERDLESIELAMVGVKQPVYLLIESTCNAPIKLAIKDEIRAAILAIVENDLEEEMEDICKKLKLCDIGNV